MHNMAIKYSTSVLLELSLLSSITKSTLLEIWVNLDSFPTRLQYLINWMLIPIPICFYKPSLPHHPNSHKPSSSLLHLSSLQNLVLAIFHMAVGTTEQKCQVLLCQFSSKHPIPYFIAWEIRHLINIWWVNSWIIDYLHEFEWWNIQSVTLWH